MLLRLGTPLSNTNFNSCVRLHLSIVVTPTYMYLRKNMRSAYRKTVQKTQNDADITNPLNVSLL